MYSVTIVASPGCPLQNIRNKRAVEWAWKCRWCFWQPFPGTHSYDETPLIVIFWCAPASRTHLNTKSFFFALGVRLEAQSCVIVLSMTGPSCEKRDTNKIYIHCVHVRCMMHMHIFTSRASHLLEAVFFFSMYGLSSSKAVLEFAYFLNVCLCTPRHVTKSPAV